MRRRSLFSCERQPGTVDGGPYDQILIVKNQRAVDRDGHRLIAFVELPLVDTLPVMPEVDAAMTQEVPRRCGRRMGFEV